MSAQKPQGKRRSTLKGVVRSHKERVAQMHKRESGARQQRQSLRLGQTAARVAFDQKRRGGMKATVLAKDVQRKIEELEAAMKERESIETASVLMKRRFKDMAGSRAARLRQEVFDEERDLIFAELEGAKIIQRAWRNYRVQRDVNREECVSLVGSPSLPLPSLLLPSPSSLSLGRAHTHASASVGRPLVC